MPAVIAIPELIAGAAMDLAAVGSTLTDAHITAAPALSVLPTAADEVSRGVAHVFSEYARGYQALAGRAAAFHSQFVQRVMASAHAYVSAEAVNASALQPLSAIVDSLSGAVGTVQAQLANMFNTTLQQISNTLTGFWNSVKAIGSEAFIDVAAIIFFLALLVAWAYYVQNGGVIPPGGFPI